MTNERRTRSMSRHTDAGTDTESVSGKRAASRLPVPKTGNTAKAKDAVLDAHPADPAVGTDRGRPAVLEEPQAKATGRNDPPADTRGRSERGRPAERKASAVVADPAAEEAAAVKLMLKLNPALSKIFDRLEYLENVVKENLDADKTIRGIDPETIPDEPKGKGKGTDPKNWGGLGIPPEELSIDAQKKMLEGYQKPPHMHAPPKDDTPVDDDDARVNDLYAAYMKEKARVEYKRNGTGGRISDSPMSRDLEDFIGLGAGFETPKTARRLEHLMPSAQLNKNSLVAKHLAEAGPPPGLSTPNTGSRSTPMEFFDASGAAVGRAMQRFRPLAPTEIDKYHGDEDPVKFLKFVTQCKRFVREAGLAPEDHVARCANFLQGRAYKYYATMVSMDEGNWTLEEFLIGIYDHCFPLDFRLKQRKKLDEFRQGNMRVKAYAAELELLFRLVGDINDAQRVDKLWNGLRRELQQALWREGLDFKSSTWDEVIAVATRHEMADRIT